MVSILGFQSKKNIADKLKLSVSLVNRVLEFLLSKSLIYVENNRYKIGESRIHLDSTSQMIFKHHTNWRIEAIKSLESQDKTNLHYSSVLTMSKKDAQKVKNILLKTLESIEPILGPSAEEEICSLCLDFFTLGERL